MLFVQVLITMARVRVSRIFFDIKISVNLREGDYSSSFFPSPIPDIFILSKIIGKNQRESNNVEDRDENGLDKQVPPKNYLKNIISKKLLYLSVQVISKISEKY